MCVSVCVCVCVCNSVYYIFPCQSSQVYIPVVAYLLPSKGNKKEVYAVTSLF